MLQNTMIHCLYYFCEFLDFPVVKIVNSNMYNIKIHLYKFLIDHSKI